MNERLQYIKGIIAAAVFVALSFGVLWLIRQFQPGLSAIVIDGIEADIFDGNAELESALGERFAVRSEDSSLPSDKTEDEVKFSCYAQIDMDGVRISAYAADDIDSVTLYNGSPANMSLEEYSEAFDGSIRVYGNGDILCAEVLEIDGRLISAESIEADMEKYNISTGGAPTYVYARDILSGSTEHILLMQCWFEGGECRICSFQSMEAI